MRGFPWITEDRTIYKWNSNSFQAYPIALSDLTTLCMIISQVVSFTYPQNK